MGGGRIRLGRGRAFPFGSPPVSRTRRKGSLTGGAEALNRKWEETMKTRYTVALSVLAGVAVGAAAVQALHAQVKPPAYVVAEIDIANVEPFDRGYVPPAAKGIADGGGKYIVRGGRTVTFSGEP